MKTYDLIKLLDDKVKYVIKDYELDAICYCGKGNKLTESDLLHFEKHSLNNIKKISIKQHLIIIYV